jgi:pimeloyl-ACP methyl ester carboxylesterase
MNRFLCALCSGILLCLASSAAASAPPAQVPTVFVHGFVPAGGSATGPVGDDYSLSYASALAATLGLPDALTSPNAMNQVAATTYYGDQYPSYYSAQDIADVNAATTTYGGGVPRYAAIVAKYVRHVLNRTGAHEANLVGVSFGALVSRYIIEKDLEHLASSGAISRWICIEGVVAGNYAATNGGPLAEAFFDQYYGGAPVDLEHMKYQWVAANIHNPRESSDSPWLANIPMHFWMSADDNLFGKFVTNMSGKANDGVVLLDDAVLKNLPASLLYQGLVPTESTLHANHNTIKDNMGLAAGLAAQLNGRNRATITLKNVTVLREFDGLTRGQGEYVFGVKFYSPVAETLGVTDPIQDLRAEDNSFPFVPLSVGSMQSLNLVWFDDMLLPGETQLRLMTNVEEIDGDVIYDIKEASGESRQALQNAQTLVDVTKDGDYPLQTDDWTATIHVEVNRYPEFGSGSSAADDWTLYE